MSEREETFHDIVEREAWHDYDPEPDYDKPTEAEESDVPEWQRRRRPERIVERPLGEDKPKA